MSEAIEGAIVLQELMTIDQLPVITERFAIYSEAVDARIARARAMPVTLETVKAVKAERAALNKEFGDIEAHRKAFERDYSAPLAAFKDSYKKYVSDKIRAALSDLDAETDKIENGIKVKKTEEVTAYFSEYAASRHVDFLTWEKTGIKVNLSTSTKSLKDDAKAFIDHICEGLELIETQEHKDEILVEFYKTLNAPQSVKTVVDRHRAIEAQKARQAELAAMKAAEAEVVKKVEAAAPVAPPTPIAPPVVIDPPPANAEPTYKVAFVVDATKDVLSDLVGYMRINGINFRQIPLKNIVESEAVKVG